MQNLEAYLCNLLDRKMYNNGPCSFGICKQSIEVKRLLEAQKIALKHLAHAPQL